MTESALLASLGVAAQAARPLGRGFGGGVTRGGWAGTPARWILGVGLCLVGLMLASWALFGALLDIFDTFLNAFEFFWRLLVDLGWDFNVFSLRFSLILRDVSFIRGYRFEFGAIATTS